MVQFLVKRMTERRSFGERNENSSGNGEWTFFIKARGQSRKQLASDHCYKFIYSVNGTMTYQTNRSQISLDEQQFIVFNPHDEHKQLALENTKFLIEIEPSFLNRAARAIIFFCSPNPQSRLQLIRRKDTAQLVKRQHPSYKYLIPSVHTLKTRKPAPKSHCLN